MHLSVGRPFSDVLMHAAAIAGLDGEFKVERFRINQSRTTLGVAPTTLMRLAALLTLSGTLDLLYLL